MLTVAWRVLRFHPDWPCLLCLVCNRMSYNPHDVEHHYCVACHLFLADLPPDYPGDATEGRSPGPLLHSQQDPPAPVLHRMPWDKPVPPAIAACPLCDCHGFAEAWDGAGTSWMLPCPHDRERLRANAARQGYQLVRADRSREPPLPPPEGGPGA